MKSIRSKMGQKGIEPHSEKEAKKSGVMTEANRQVSAKVSTEIAQEATGIYEQRAVVGEFIFNNYNTIARSKGLSLVDYVQQAMIFFTNYYDMIEKLERKIRDQEQTIEELTEFLDPVRYRMKVIELMVAQEAQGITFDDDKIRRYLTAVDFALAKDVLQPPEPEKIGGESPG